MLMAMVGCCIHIFGTTLDVVGTGGDAGMHKTAAVRLAAAVGVATAIVPPSAKSASGGARASAGRGGGMGGKTKIEWCRNPDGTSGVTWNPVLGCSPAPKHPGCLHCYAPAQYERIVACGSSPKSNTSQRRNAELYGRCVRDGKWTGEIVLMPERLGTPLRWRKRRTVFVDSMNDLFHHKVPDEFIAAVFAVMAACPQHRFIVLTKRPARMRAWFAGLAHRCRDELGCWTTPIAPCLFYAQERIAHPYLRKAATSILASSWPLPNLMVGVSVSDQETWDSMVPDLLATPAAFRCVSVEPMLGPILARGQELRFEPMVATYGGATIDQVIIGAESGPGRRPCDIKWAQDLGRQVLEAQRPMKVAVLASGAVVPCAEGMFTGPALFIKQLDVCERCAGRGGVLTPDLHPGISACPHCRGCGQTGKLRDQCPTLYIPGYGAEQWKQFPPGWRG